MHEFQWPPRDVAPGGPQMNKFEEVSSDHHQMPLAGGPHSDVEGAGEMVTWDPSLWIDRHTPVKTLPSRNFV